MSRIQSLSRRELFAVLGVAGCSVSGWLGALARAATDPARKRSCILLWMAGGPSQMDTFDLKPGHANGGPIREIATAVPGVKVSEHLPLLAKQMKRLAVIRSMSTREGDHGRATYHLRTGYVQQAPIDYPPLGAALAKELGNPAADLPGFISIAPARGANNGAGFLGPRYAPLMVGSESESGAGDRALKVQDVSPGVRKAQAEARVGLLDALDRDFVVRHPDPGPLSHQAAFEGAVRLMKPAAARAFDLDEEPDRLRDAYGRSLFGQGCLLARRLVEHGVPFIEVALGGWDTHVQNFDAVKRLCGILDPA
jgi:Protein of unknown function (DUF1501)